LNASNKILSEKLSVNSNTDNLSHIREFTRTSAEKAGFSEDTIGKIILAVDEACTNIIKHAYKNLPGGIIDIEIEYSNPRFAIKIVDQGISFDVQKVPEPDIQEYYKQKRIGGLGVYLMKKLMDEVNYSTLKNNRNQIEIVKYLTR
jgi:serine/threonine-protein kinase RsbW